MIVRTVCRAVGTVTVLTSYWIAGRGILKALSEISTVSIATLNDDSFSQEKFKHWYYWQDYKVLVHDYAKALRYGKTVVKLPGSEPQGHGEPPRHGCRAARLDLRAPRALRPSPPQADPPW